MISNEIRFITFWPLMDACLNMKLLAERQQIICIKFLSVSVASVVTYSWQEALNPNLVTATTKYAETTSVTHHQ